MTWIIVSAIVSLIVLLFLIGVAQEPTEDLSYWGIVVVWPLVSAFLAAILGAVMILISLFFGVSETTETKTGLRALGNNTSTSASFFLGSGHAGSKAVFQYIQRDANGGNHLKSVDAEDATIFEDEASDPYLITHWNVFERDWWVPGASWKAESGYDFHIPADSINTDYKVSVTD